MLTFWKASTKFNLVMGCTVAHQVTPNLSKTTHLDLKALMNEEYISADHTRIIKKTWNKLSRNIPGIGAKILLRIFELNPIIKETFPFKDVSDAALVKDPHFKGHASRFMQSVGAAVDNIDDLPKTMGPMLVTLGGEHFRFKGFQMEYWDTFVEAILFIWMIELKHALNEEVARAWRGLFVFMVIKLKEGYQREHYSEEFKNGKKVTNSVELR